MSLKSSVCPHTYPPCSPLVSCVVLACVLFELAGWGQVARDAGESLSYITAQLVQILR